MQHRGAIGKPRTSAIYPAVFLTSAGVLMLQVALTRLFSFTLWYHFAYVVISVALLGYGASGALLSAFPGILRGNLPRTLFACATGCAVAIPAGLLVYAHTPFYPLQLFRQPAQWWYLAAYYAAAGIPFFLAGVCIAGAMAAASERVTRVYCADLMGAGLGAALVVSAIWRLETPGVVIAAAGLMAGAAACWAWWWRPALAAAPLTLVVLLVVGGGPFWRSIQFRPSVEKCMALQLGLAHLSPPAGDLSEAEQTPLAEASGKWRILPDLTRWGAVFRVDVLEHTGDSAGAARARQAGSSDDYGEPPLAHISIPHDGDANAMIYAGGDRAWLNRFFMNHAVSLPYALLGPQPDVLIIGAGGGREVHAALCHRARSTTALDLDPLTVRLVTHSLADYSGYLAEQPGVRFVVGEGRSFVRQSKRRYDLIEMNQVDSLTAASIGASVLFENYLFTVEAIGDYLAHLREGGVYCQLHLNPPPETEDIRFKTSILRAGAALEALRRRGVKRPQDCIAVIYAKGLMTYVVRPRPFTRAETALLRDYCKRQRFVQVHLPYHRLDNELSRYLRTSPRARAQSMLSSALRRDPPTDDRPFVWPYFKWLRVFDPLHHYRARHAVASGQLVMIPLLGVALAGALAFILGPLALFRRRGIRSPAAGGLTVYFAALGFGFMFIEISFIQRFVLFLGYPTYSLTVVLSALLVASGVGSLTSQRLITRAEQSLLWALGGLLVVGGLYLAFGGAVFGAFLGYALWLRIMVAVLMIAPLGFVMGMFFPTGIRVVNDVAPQFVPWAWGINASTSVVAAILAVMLAMTVGFRMVGVYALGIYVIGVIALYVAHRRGRAAHAVADTQQAALRSSVAEG
ncbi:MAG: hypothetical protein JSV65_06700 [Armatimonadota bacterium]|nr:MAG: hypothetical protein JSV65_06700 [Armatimonadota bacterium]